MLAYDMMAVSPLDFTTRISALKEVTEEGILSNEQVSELHAKIDEALELTDEAWEIVKKVNAEYLQALSDNDDEKAEQLLTEYKKMNATVLAAFKECEDNFVRLTWEDVSQFLHEHSVNNISNLIAAKEALEKGDVDSALDEYLWNIDNNWYAYNFSKETYDYFTDYVLNQPADRLMWGAGRVQGHNDLYDVINALCDKDETSDFSEEIAEIEACIEYENKLLAEAVKLEIDGLDMLIASLNEIVK